MAVKLPFSDRVVPVDGNLLLELTKRCNYECLHCYADASPRARGPEPTVEEVLTLAASARRLGFHAITLTGGEPLLYRELDSVVAGWPPDLGLWLFTSGIRLDLRRLAAWSSTVTGYAVSLDGPRPRHNWLRGSPRSFDDIIRFARLVGALGLRAHMQSMVLRDSQAHMGDIVALAEAVGIERVLFSHVSPHGRGVELIDQHMAADELDALFDVVGGLQATTPVRLDTNLIDRTRLDSDFPDPVVHVVGSGAALPWFGAPPTLSLGDVAAAAWNLEAASSNRPFPAVVDDVFTRARARAEAYPGRAVPVDDIVVDECRKAASRCG